MTWYINKETRTDGVKCTLTFNVMSFRIRSQLGSPGLSSKPKSSIPFILAWCKMKFLGKSCHLTAVLFIILMWARPSFTLCLVLTHSLRFKSGPSLGRLAWLRSTLFLCLFCVVLKKFFWERERKREGEMQAGEGQRQGDTEVTKRALCGQQKARCGASVHKPWDHDLGQRQTPNRLSHLGTPGPLWISYPCFDFHKALWLLNYIVLSILEHWRQLLTFLALSRF